MVAPEFLVCVEVSHGLANDGNVTVEAVSGLSYEPAATLHGLLGGYLAGPDLYFPVRRRGTDSRLWVIHTNDEVPRVVEHLARTADSTEQSGLRFASVEQLVRGIQCSKNEYLKIVRLPLVLGASGRLSEAKAVAIAALDSGSELADRHIYAGFARRLCDWIEQADKT
jgi:hypothetical protein